MKCYIPFERELNGEFNYGKNSIFDFLTKIVFTPPLTVVSEYIQEIRWWFI